MDTSIDTLNFIQRTLGCSAELAVDVLGRVQSDPAWPKCVVDLEDFELIVWKHFHLLRVSALAQGNPDPILGTKARPSAGGDL